MEQMKIGQLAKELDLNTQTIRYYERIGDQESLELGRAATTGPTGETAPPATQDFF